MSYFRDMYGARSKEFIEGVIAGIEAYAVWKDGEQTVGIKHEPLKKVIEEVKRELGWPEESSNG